MGPRPTIATGFRARTPNAMPVRSLTPSLLRWPEPEPILNQGRRPATGQPLVVASVAISRLLHPASRDEEALTGLPHGPIAPSPCWAWRSLPPATAPGCAAAGPA